MPVDIDVTRKDDVISLTVSGFPKDVGKKVEDRVAQLRHVLSEIVAAETAFDTVVDHVPDTRIQAYQAIELKYQMTLQAAAQYATLARCIADGSEAIEDHGFPEFADE